MDYIIYENVEEAVHKIESLLRDEKVLQEMLIRNQLRFSTIIENFGFWKFAMNSLDLIKTRV